jgi:hypothetical protein
MVVCIEATTRVARDTRVVARTIFQASKHVHATLWQRHVRQKCKQRTSCGSRTNVRTWPFEIAVISVGRQLGCTQIEHCAYPACEPVQRKNVWPVSPPSRCGGHHPSLMRGLVMSCLPSVARRTPTACHPKLVRRSEQAHLRASRYGGHPSPALMSEGWWTRRESNP